MYALFNDISEDATYPNQRFSRYNSYDLQGLSPQSSCSHAAHPDFNHFPGVHGGALNALGQEDPCQWFFLQGPSDEKYPLGAPTFDTGDTRPQFVYPPDLSGLVSPNDWIVPSTLNSQYNRFVPSTLNSRYNRHLHSEEGSRMRLDNIIASVSAPPPGVSGHSPSEDRSRVWLRNTEAPISALLPGINEHSYQSNTLDSWISHFPNTSASSRGDATPGYGSFPQSTRMHSDESHSSQWDPSPDPMVLPSGRGAPSNMISMGIPHQPQCITSMPSYFSLGGWNGGFFNSTTTMSAITRPYDSSSICVNPWSNTAAAPDFTQTGDSVSLMSFPTHSQEVSREQEPNWPSAVAWVDGAHTRATANPNCYNVGSEPRTESKSFTVCGYRSPNNERVRGHPPANAFIFIPHGSIPQQKPKPRNKRAKRFLLGPKCPRGIALKHFPKSSSPFSSSPASSSSSSIHTELLSSEVPCHYGNMHCRKTVCSLATVLDHPLRHWVVHVRDELRAISNNTIKLCDGRIVTTDHKHRIAEQYLTHFCPNPACHQTWSRAEQVRTHIKNSRECSLLAYCGGCKGCGECPNCLAGDAQCQNCKRCARRRRRLISGAYLTIAKELGYVPPARLDRIFILDEEAQEQELEERSALDEEDDIGIV
ncbi:hypothetical protein BU17DRAFT_100396 [Hysterangium stoloniferum]|nr:hypothetical protein BU17DRAFT_100396 [Hysterangium stoloniferum]